MKTLTLPITNGTFLASDVTVSGTNDSATHNVYVAFTQADSGYVAIQYKVSGSSNWQPMGKVDLTDTEVATFKVSGVITDWRFVVADASGTGSIEVTDSEKLEDIHPLSFYGETGGMSPDEIGDSIERARSMATIAGFSSCDFVNEPKLDRDWMTTGADITPTINTASAIASGVTIGYDEPTKYQLQGFPRDLLTVSSGYIVGDFPSGEVPTKHRSFYYTGQTLEVRFRDLSGGKLKIYSDGVLRAEITTGNANAPRWALIDFGSAADTNYARRIDIVSRFEYWGGLVIEPNTTIFPTRDKNPRIAVVGDSITAGTGSDGISWAKSSGMMLNCPDLYTFGIGGSGYINNGQAAVGVGEFINRLQNVVDQSPDYVVVAGGINDQAATDAAFQAAVDEYYTALLTHFTKDQIVICSPFNPGNSAAKILSYRSILEAKAAEIGCHFVDFISPDGLDGIYTGTGDSGAKTGDGNADIYISSDGIHPNQSGHNHAGRFFAWQFYKSA